MIRQAPPPYRQARGPGPSSSSWLSAPVPQQAHIPYACSCNTTPSWEPTIPPSNWNSPRCNRTAQMEVVAGAGEAAAAVPQLPAVGKPAEAEAGAEAGAGAVQVSSGTLCVHSCSRRPSWEHSMRTRPLRHNQSGSLWLSGVAEAGAGGAVGAEAVEAA